MSVTRKIVRPVNSRWGGFDYSINWKPQGTVKFYGEDAFGVTDHNSQTIDIEDGMTPEREVAMLIHEPLHQMIDTAKVVFQGDPEEVEEKLCTFVGDALAGHIRDNPQFWRYLLQRLAPRKRKRA